MTGVNDQVLDRTNLKGQVGQSQVKKCPGTGLDWLLWTV